LIGIGAGIKVICFGLRALLRDRAPLHHIGTIGHGFRAGARGQQRCRRCPRRAHQHGAPPAWNAA
jgi:hypothetical protein